MPTLDRQFAAGDQFSFSSTSSAGVVGDDYGLAFGEWTGWHSDNCHSSGHYDEPQWLAKASSQSSAEPEQAIARYEEMLEMLKDGPEDACELSLRDLAELPRMARAARESPARERVQKNRPRSFHSRGGSMETGGFLLKMFFPLPSAGTKRKSKSSRNRLNPSSRSSSSGSSSGAESVCSRKVPTKPLTKDGKKAIADETSDEQEHAILRRNCSRHHGGCYPLFLNQKKNRSMSI